MGRVSSHPDDFIFTLKWITKGHLNQRDSHRSDCQRLESFTLTPLQQFNILATQNQGRLAQRESTAFTRQGSVVRSHYRPPYISIAYEHYLPHIQGCTDAGTDINLAITSKAHPEGWPVYVRVRGQNRRSADALIGFVWEHCRAEFGHNATFLVFAGRSQMPQNRSFITPRISGAALPHPTACAC